MKIQSIPLRKMTQTSTRTGLRETLKVPRVLGFPRSGLKSRDGSADCFMIVCTVNSEQKIKWGEQWGVHVLFLCPKTSIDHVLRTEEQVSSCFYKGKINLRSVLTSFCPFSFFFNVHSVAVDWAGEKCLTIVWM